VDAKQTANQQTAARISRRRKGLLWRSVRETLLAWVFLALIAAWWAVAILKVPAVLLPPSRIRG
jgi:hypothetical protein